MDTNDVQYYNKDSSFYFEYKQIKSNNMRVGHFHDTYEIYYLMSGSRIFFIKDKMIDVPENSLIIIHPNVLHRVINAPESDYTRFITYFNMDAFPSFLINDFTISPFLKNDYIVFQFTEREREAANKFVKPMIEEALKKETGYEITLYGLFLQYLAFCFRCIKKDHPVIPSIKNPTYIRTTEVVKYINEHYNEDLSLDVLADKFYVSPFHLCRKFKEVTQFSLSNYINIVRIKEAIIIMNKAPKKSIKSIAKEVGFKSYTNFSRAFKEITGHSPMYYKKNNISSTTFSII